MYFIYCVYFHCNYIIYLDKIIHKNLSKRKRKGKYKKVFHKLKLIYIAI